MVTPKQRKEHRKKRVTNLNIRCTEEDLERWRRLARMRGISLSAWVRRRLD